MQATQSAPVNIPPQAAPSAPTPGSASSNPTLVYRALRQQRDILGTQMDEMQGLQNDLLGKLSTAPAEAKEGLQARLKTVQTRINDLDAQIQKSDQAVANAAAVPGTVTRPPDTRRDTPDPDMVFGVSALIVGAVLFPLAIAFARRIWRRSARVETMIPAEMTDRMAALERGVEAIALEVERIGEGQRFVTQALSERAPARIEAGTADRR